MKNNNEIGSEFELDGSLDSTNKKLSWNGWVLTYSGRTSIRLVLDDILFDGILRKAWIPSYCCSSMIQPFLDKRLEIEFYDVNILENNQIIRGVFNPSANDIVLSISYFGFYDKGNDDLIRKCRNDNVIVIEDCTHSLLLDEKFIADYRITSIRKWFPLASGGGVKKRKGMIKWNSIEPNAYLISVKFSAMKSKLKYLNYRQEEDEKQDFMKKFKKFNDSLTDSYANQKIDDLSFFILREQDIVDIIRKRRKNSLILINGLKGSKKVKLLFNELGEKDCPLFVPIMVKDRERLQQMLSHNKIYSPIHWPQPNVNTKSNLFETELSLVCDQRYDSNDMFKILKIIRNFERE